MHSVSSILHFAGASFAQMHKAWCQTHPNGHEGCVLKKAFYTHMFVSSKLKSSGKLTLYGIASCQLFSAGTSDCSLPFACKKHKHVVVMHTQDKAAQV